MEVVGLDMARGGPLEVWFTRLDALVHSDAGRGRVHSSRSTSGPRRVLPPKASARRFSRPFARSICVLVMREL